MDDSRIDAFRREVNLNLAVGALSGFDLPVTGDDGRRHVVVALESEPLSTLLGRLRAVGGFANVFVRGSARVRLVSVVDVSSALLADDAEDLTAPDDRPGRDATVGMFLDYLSTCPQGVLLSSVTGAAAAPALATEPREVSFV